MAGRPAPLRADGHGHDSLSGRRRVSRLGAVCPGRVRGRHLQSVERHGQSVCERGQRVLVGGRAGREDRRRIPVRHSGRRQRPLAQEPVRQRGRELVRQRHHSRSQFRLDRRRLRDAAVERTGDLRNARRHVQRRRRRRLRARSTKSSRSSPTCAISASTRSRSCRWSSSRWTTRGATTRRSRSRSKRRSAARRGLYRFVKAAHAHGIAVIIDVVYNHFGPGDLDLWRFDGWSDGDHDGGIYFYDNDRAHTPWGDTRPDYGRPGGAPVHPRQRAVLAEQVPARRPAVRLGDQHPQPRREQQRPWQRSAGRLESAAVDQRRDPRAAAVENHDRRGSAEQRLDHARDVGAGGAGFGSQWDAGFVHPIRDAIITAKRRRSRSCQPCAARSVIVTTATRRGGSIYTESHDEVANGHARVPGRDLAGQCRQLVLAQTLDARRRAGLLPRPASR